MKRLFMLMVFSIVLLVTPIVAEASSTHQYQDISKNSRYHAALNTLQEAGALEDVSQQTYYYPSKEMAREDVAVMIARAKNLALPQQVRTFQDVTLSNSKAKYIQAVADAGIISGFPDGTFRPKATVTRGELAIFLQRAFDLPSSTKVKFKDVTSNGTMSAKAISALVSANITAGYPDGTFRPNAPVKRGEVAILTANTLMLFYEASYYEGGYIVGADLPAGEYMFYSTMDDAQFAVFNFNNGKSLYNATWTDSVQLYMTLEKGQAISFEGGILYPAASVTHENLSQFRNGMYKAGYDIPVGQVTLVPRGAHAMYSISTSSRLTTNSTVETKFIQSPTTIQLKKGQYLFVDYVSVR